MTEEYSRTQRIASLMQAELARIIQLEMIDPRVKFVTVTHVKVFPDLSYAKVYIIVHDEKQEEEALSALNSAAKFLRHQLSQSMDLRKTPVLQFFYDESVRTGDHISQLFKEISEKEKNETKT